MRALGGAKRWPVDCLARPARPGGTAMVTPVRSVALLLVLATTTGCSRDLRVKSISENSERVGIGYVLPFTQFAIVESWSLDYCFDPETAKPDAPKEPRVTVKVEATPTSVEDGSLAFIMDPQDLQTLTNVAAFNAKWYEGTNMLSSINASSEDRTAQIIGNLTKIAIKLVPLFGGGLTASTASNDPDCTAAGLAAWRKAAKARTALKAATDDVETATAEVKRLTEKVAQQGANVDDATKNDLGKAIDRLVQANVAQANAAEAFGEAMKPISSTRKFRWPTDSNSFSRGPDNPPEPVRSWLNGQGIAKLRPIYLQIERSGTFGRDPLACGPGPCPDPRPASELAGLRYRMPVAGRLVACSMTPCRSLGDGVIASFEAPIAQLGYVNVLRFRGQTFGNNSFGAEFTQNGSLKMVAYDQKSAPGEGATGAGADSVGQLSDAFNPTARLNAQTAYLKALKERRDAEQALKTDPNSWVAAETAALGADTALINARIANLNAQIALEELRARQGGQH